MGRMSLLIKLLIKLAIANEKLKASPPPIDAIVKEFYRLLKAIEKSSYITLYPPKDEKLKELITQYLKEEDF